MVRRNMILVNQWRYGVFSEFSEQYCPCRLKATPVDPSEHVIRLERYPEGLKTASWWTDSRNLVKKKKKPRYPCWPLKKISTSKHPAFTKQMCLWSHSETQQRYTEHSSIFVHELHFSKFWFFLLSIGQTKHKALMFVGRKENDASWR